MRFDYYLCIIKKYKIYLTVLLLYATAYCLGIAIRFISYNFYNNELGNLIFKITIALVFTVYIYKYKTFKQIRFVRVDSLSLIIGITIISIFILNNLLMIYLNFRIDYKDSQGEIIFALTKIMVSSIGEEITYRGFIQNYINTKIDNRSNKFFSKGNIFASIIMWVSHIGFFFIMPFSFALSSIILVLIFSLSVGFIMDKTHNILLPIFIHIVINVIHVFIHTYLYLY